MKRYGHIIEEIAEYGNISDSFDYVLRGKRKKTRSGRWLTKHRHAVIKALQRSLGNGTWRVGKHKTIRIKERGKEREIDIVSKKDRIALNAIMSVVERYLTKRFVSTSAASIKGRGTHYLQRRILSAMKHDPEGTVYAYKNDITQFYHSIMQSAVRYAVRRVFKDARLLAMLDSCIGMLAEGLSIGLRSSQSLGNLILDYYVDHVLKDEMGVAHYFRYCDDALTLAASYAELTEVREVTHAQLGKVGLKVKGNEQMYATQTRAVDFLGFTMGHDGHVRVRKHIKQRFARRWRRVRSERRREELAGSFYGLAKHAHARHLFKTLTGISMRDFADFGLKFTSKDGKKQFDVPSVPLGDLQNTSIIVRDYEQNIHTREGEGRYVVLFEHGENGKEGKFITNSEELKQMLDQIAQLADGFPFKTTIKRVAFGNNKYKYSFT